MEISPIEENKLKNIDLLQIEYFSDLELSEKDAIVIEPNNIISMTIRKFLVNLDFENIHLCAKINEGIEIFTQYIRNDVNVPIIIDEDAYKNIKNSIDKILEIQPGAYIIIITTKEKMDPQILKLINSGISSIMQKPLKFNEFKESFSYIDGKEEEINESAVEDKTNESPATENLKLPILVSSKLSQNKIKHLLKKEFPEIEKLIKNLIENKKIISDKEVLEASCNRCNSTNLTYTSECPNCKGINFQQKGLIEHYSCGEVYPKEGDYNTCPKCNKQIGKVGAEYREFSEYYACSSCNDRFPKPTTKFVCLDCENEFIEKLASWNRGKFYKIQK